MKPRTLIILGAVLVALFVVGVGGGIISGGNSQQISLTDLQNAPWRESFDNALTRKLDPTKDLALQSGSGCIVQPDQITIPTGTTCVFQVGSTAIPVNRRLSLQILDGAQVAFDLVQSDSLPTKPEAKDSKISLDIYKSGGTLSLNCQNAPSSSNACTLRIE